MKKILWMAAIMVVASCQQKEKGENFEVEGEIKNAATQMVYLEENTPNGRPTIIDSAQLKNDGSFRLKAKTAQENLYQLRLQGKMVPFALLISDKKKIKVNADLNNAAQPYTVQNSEATQALLNFDKTLYEKGMQLFTQGGRVDSLQKAAAPDSVVAGAYRNLQATANDLKAYAQEFLKKNQSPVLTLYALSSFQNSASNLGIQGFSKPEIAQIINSASEKFPEHTALQDVKKGLPSAKAQDFTQPDVNGKPVSLSQFKGQYVLVDFWASWCQPCRQDNPNVVKAYNQFKNKNFTVLGVSLDQKREAWLQAIQQDGLTWTHVSDLKFWDNAAASLYGVQGIPYNVLVDPEGNIIGENLHGEELMATLRTVLK